MAAAKEIGVDVLAKDKAGNTVTIGDKVSHFGRAGVVKQVVVDHPVPPVEFLEHATFSVVVKFDDGDEPREERRVKSAELEKA